MNLARPLALVASLALAPAAFAAEPSAAAPPAPALPAPTVAAAPAPVAEAPIPFGFDFAPWVGVSSVAPERRRVFSFNLVGGLSGGVDAFELSAGVGITTGEVRGGQVAGGANLVMNDLSGAQVAGGLNLVTGTAAGVQVASVNVALEGLRGAQVGSVNLAGAVRGLQVGAVNLADGSVAGVRVGAVNVSTGHVSGFQVAAVNVAPSADASVGVLNVFWDGWTDADATLSDAGVLLAGVRHGSGALYNVYYAGAHLPGGDEATQAAFGIGIGGRKQLSQRVEVAVDVLGTQVAEGGRFGGQRSLATLRPHVTFRLHDLVALYAGPTLNLQLSEAGDSLVEGPFGAWTLSGEGADTTVRMWPGASVGLRLL